MSLAEEIIESGGNIVRQIGWERVELVQINNSKACLGVRRDWHENLGEGRIGIEGLKTLVNFLWFAGNFRVTELGEKEKPDKRIMEILKNLLNGM